MTRSSIVLLALACMLPGVASAQSTTLQIPGDPVVGAPLTLRLVDAHGDPLPDVQLEAKYRENALEALRHTQRLGTTDAAGAVLWTPEEAGVVMLRWPSGAQSVSVRYARTPVLGLLIAILAGLLLLGGTVVFLVQMLRTPVAAEPAADDP